jgi:predicted Zn-dependent protease with MMP-like domain
MLAWYNSSPMSLVDAEFDAVVQDAVRSLPVHIREKLHDVAIVVEPRAKGRRGATLLGLYEGVPLTTWGRNYSGKATDKITLYKETIEAYARTPEEIPHVIRETLLHEIAHYLGFDHDKIHGMERRWKAKRTSTKKV